MSSLYAEADALPLMRYAAFLGCNYSDPLAACCALCEALSERVRGPFALSARQVAEYVYGDRLQFMAGGALIKTLEDIGFLTKAINGDPERREAAKYVITSRALGELR